MDFAANAQVSGAQQGAADRAKMAKPCPSKRGVLSVRMRSKATNGLTALLASILFTLISGPFECSKPRAAKNRQNQAND